jgi:hypothetical protein
MAMPVLEPVPQIDDPVWRAVLAAPVGAPETDEERAAYENLLTDIRAGRRGVGRDAVLATIERMRAEQGDGEVP